MKISVERTGGIAAFAKPLGGTIEVDELSEGLAAKVKEKLKPALLDNAVTSTGPEENEMQIDRQEIKVRVWDEDSYGEASIGDHCPDTDMFDLCNEIVNEVVKKQIG